MTSKAPRAKWIEVVEENAARDVADGEAEAAVPRGERLDRPRDHTVDPAVSGEVPIGLLEQLARELQLSLGFPLSEVEIDPVGSVEQLGRRALKLDDTVYPFKDGD